MKQYETVDTVRDSRATRRVSIKKRGGNHSARIGVECVSAGKKGGSGKAVKVQWERMERVTMMQRGVKVSQNPLPKFWKSFVKCINQCFFGSYGSINECKFQLEFNPYSNLKHWIKFELQPHSYYNRIHITTPSKVIKTRIKPHSIQLQLYNILYY